MAKTQLAIEFVPLSREPMYIDPLIVRSHLCCSLITFIQK